MNKVFFQLCFSGIVVLFLFTGCNSTPGQINPAQEIIFSSLATSGRADLNEQSGRVEYRDDQGTDVVTGLQYYVSRRIVMTQVSDTTKQSSVSSTGVGTINLGNVRNTFTIEDSTDGVVLSPEEDNGKVHAYRDELGRLVLEVAFETENNYTINFVQDDTNPSSHFHIVYTNPEEHEIQYGDVTYKVEWPESALTLDEISLIRRKPNSPEAKEIEKKRVYYTEPPYLLVRVDINTETTDNTKKASGRKVGGSEKKRKPFDFFKKRK